MKRYLRHVTLTTGHTRDAYRSEVADGVIALLRPLIERAVTGEHTPLPGAVEPRCTLTGGVHGRCVSLTVWGPPLHPAAFPQAADIGDRPVPIVEIGIAAHSRCGAHLWRQLHEIAASTRTPVVTDPAHCPAEPWVAALLYVGAAVYTDSMDWLGDFERCVGWTWLEMMESRS